MSAPLDESTRYGTKKSSLISHSESDVLMAHENEFFIDIDQSYRVDACEALADIDFCKTLEEYGEAALKVTKC